MMDGPIKTAAFKPLELVHILSISESFKTTCDSNSILEGAIMWLFPYFTWKSAKPALLHWVTTDNEREHRQECKLSTYFQYTNYLLKSYEADDVIAKADTMIVYFKQPARKFAVHYSQVLWEKEITCVCVYDEPGLKKIFTEGLHRSNCYSIRAYWAANKDATLHSLARCANLLVKR